MPEKSHRIPLVVLIAFAFLTLLVEVQWVAYPFYAGEAYQGINIAHFGNDVHLYLSRAKEVLEGNGVGQPFLAEAKDLPDAFQSNTEQILLTPLRIIGLDSVDVVTLYNILNTVGVFLLFVLIYLFIYALSADVLLAATCAIFAIGGYVLVQNGTVLMWILRGNSLVYGAPNIFGRSADPYTALVPLFGFLILTYRAATARFERLSRNTLRPYAYVLGAGALLGLLFYDYFYAWTFALGFLGALTLTSLAWRKWHAALAAVAVGCIGVAIGAYKLVGFYQLFTSALGAQIAYFFLAEQSRALIASSTGIVVGLLMAVYFYVRRDDRNNFFLLALWMAGWIALEQQVITGKMVQYGHYYWYFVVPVSILLGIYMAVRLVPEGKRRWRVWLCGGLIALAFLNTIAGQYKSFWPTVPEKMREQDFASILWKLREMPKGVLFGDPGGDSYNMLTTIYTAHDNYWIPAATQSAFPAERYKEALLVYLYVNKETRRDPTAYLKSVLATSAPSTYADMYEEVEGFMSGISLREYRSSPPPENPAILAVRPAFLSRIQEEYRNL